MCYGEAGEPLHSEFWKQDAGPPIHTTRHRWEPHGKTKRTALFTLILARSGSLRWLIPGVLSLG
jgi:hypothetical protein